MEFGQRSEWNVWGDLQWDLLNFEPHAGVHRMVKELNALYKQEPALWKDDFDQYGFQWIDCNDNRHILHFNQIQLYTQFLLNLI